MEIKEEKEEICEEKIIENKEIKTNFAFEHQLASPVFYSTPSFEPPVACINPSGSVC